MRMMVKIFTTALTISNTVPPTDPLIALLASHSSVLSSRTQRKGIPRMVKMAMVATAEPITGNQPAGLFTNTAPTPTMAAT